MAPRAADRIRRDGLGPGPIPARASPLIHVFPTSTEEFSLHIRRVSPGLFSGWMITNTEGQHTAHVAGSQQDAVDRADLQLTACGGGRLIIDDPDEH